MTRSRTSLAWLMLAAGSPSAAAQNPVVPEQVRLGSSLPDHNVWFGWSVALDAGRLAVGAPYDDAAAQASGAVYVFERLPGGWRREQTLFAYAADVNDFFGRSVAIRGDWLAVGAPGDELGGSARVFERTAGGWIERARLVASDVATGDTFGSSVAVGEGLVVVGANRHDIAPGDLVGAAYVFELQGTNWVETQKLVASDGDHFDHYGTALALDGDWLVIGAPYVEPTPNHYHLGEAYVLQRRPQGWVEVARLFPDDQLSGGFGGSLAISGERLAVGAMGDADHGPSSGAVYVFERREDDWVRTAKLFPPDGMEDDRFGTSVALCGDRLAAGALKHDHVDDESGGAWLFARAGSGWHVQLELVPSDAEAGDWFGQSIAVDAESLAAGTIEDEYGPWFDAGSVYALDLARVPFTSLCAGDGSGSACPCGNEGRAGSLAGCASSLGVGGQLVASGSDDALVDDLTLHAGQLPSPGIALLVVGGGAPVAAHPVGDGLGCIGARRALLTSRATSADGHADFGPGLAGGWAPGDERAFQVFYRDPGASPCGAFFNATNAVRIQFAP